MFQQTVTRIALIEAMKLIAPLSNRDYETARFRSKIWMQIAHILIGCVPPMENVYEFISCAME